MQPPIPALPPGPPQLPVQVGPAPQNPPIGAPQARVPVPPQEEELYPSLLKIFGGLILKTVLVAGVALAMIYPMVELANKASSAKGLSTHSVVKFMALSMALGAVVSLIITFIAVKVPFDTE